MAAGGVQVLTQFDRFKDNLEDDFQVLGDLVDTSRVDPSLSGLAHFFNELKKGIHTAEKRFDSFHKIAEAAEGMVWKEWGYLGISDAIRRRTQWYLTRDQHTAMFSETAKHAEAAKELKQYFDRVTGELSTNPTVEGFSNVLDDVIYGVHHVIPEYLAKVQTADVLASKFLELDRGLQEATDKYLASVGMPRLNDMYGLAAQGAQHLGRIPLMLKELVSQTGKSSHAAIREKSAVLQAGLDAIEATLKSRFSSASSSAARVAPPLPPR